MLPYFRSMEAFSHFDFSLYNEIESSKKNDLKHLLVKKKSINFGTLKTIKSFAYEETVFHPIFNSVLVCDNCKRQEAERKSRLVKSCADTQ